MTRLDLTKWIRVDRSVARSVNLERDATDRRLLERFQLTPVALDALKRLADGLDGEPVNAWSLTGPYGTGKSAFCNYMIALCCGIRDARRLCLDRLRKADPKLARRLERFIAAGRPQAPAVAVRTVSQYESLNSTLARGLFNTVDALAKHSSRREWKQLRTRVAGLGKSHWPATSDIVAAVESLARLAGRPVFLVVDELGKNLEFQGHHAEKGDVFALQALAESRSLFVWVCLHQAFSAYSGALSRVQKEEWQKVQGRFEDRSYIEPPTRSFALITEALTVRLPKGPPEKLLDTWAKGMVGEAARPKLDGFPSLTVDQMKSLYPFHPLAVYLLGELTRRFAQNDRTLFSFLSSGEPHAFSACLRALEAGSGNRLPTLGLDMLYDYFSQTGALRHSDRAENQRWIEINSLIASRGDLGSARTRLLKTIGILNLLSSLPGVIASEAMVHAALATTYNKDRKQSEVDLRELSKAGVLLYRRYAKEYRLWEGTDFDLDREVLEARGRVALRSVAETLEELASRPHLVAARHSIQSGTFRDFAVQWATEDDLPAIAQQPCPDGEADGTVWLVLGKKKQPSELLDVAREGAPAIVAYAPQLEHVRHLLLDAAASAQACLAPQLERDGVARREARHRAAQTTQALVSYLGEAFAPGDNQAAWYAEGSTQRIRSQRDLSALASSLCDAVYRQCPPIKSEMLNVDRLSSAAAAARNKVAEALANSSHLEDLGFTGFGPEVAIHRALFKSTGLHKQGPDGMWLLSAPSKKAQPRLTAVWEVLDRLLSEAEATDQALPVKAILDALKQPPFGLREGPAPLLLTHYLLVHVDEVAIYEEGVFKPFFGDAEATLLMKRPDLFSLRRYRPSGLRSEVIRTYCQVVNANLQMVQGVRNQTLLSVAVPLTEFLKSLPEYTRSTRQLSANALRLRGAIATARDPQQLLFDDIPKALGLESVRAHEGDATPVDSAALRQAFWQALVELRDAFDAFVEKVRGRFILALSHDGVEPPSFEVFREDLRRRAAPLVPICLDADLKPALAALASERGEDQQWLLQVAAVVMAKPVQSWQDTDIDPFAMRMEDVRERLRHLGELHSLSQGQPLRDSAQRTVALKSADGQLLAKTLRVPAKPTAAVKKVLKLFDDADKDTRADMLACLLMSMEKEGDLQ